MTQFCPRHCPGTYPATLERSIRLGLTVLLTGGMLIQQFKRLLKALISNISYVIFVFVYEFIADKI